MIPSKPGRAPTSNAKKLSILFKTAQENPKTMKKPEKTSKNLGLNPKKPKNPRFFWGLDEKLGFFPALVAALLGLN